MQLEADLVAFGRLALYYCDCYRLSERRLAIVITVHVLIRRCDGTTAAERFFGQLPVDLFETVCTWIKLPVQAARKRPRPRKPIRLYVVETQ